MTQVGDFRSFSRRVATAGRRRRRTIKDLSGFVEKLRVERLQETRVGRAVVDQRERTLQFRVVVQLAAGGPGVAVTSLMRERGSVKTSAGLRGRGHTAAAAAATIREWHIGRRRRRDRGSKIGGRKVYAAVGSQTQWRWRSDLGHDARRQGGRLERDPVEVMLDERNVDSLTHHRHLRDLSPEPLLALGRHARHARRSHSHAVPLLDGGQSAVMRRWRRKHPRRHRSLPRRTALPELVARSR